MSGLLISIDTTEASDSWGFVGIVKVGDYEAYRTIEAFPTPAEALAATQALMGSILGEALAGAEWRKVRDVTGHAPTRRDMSLGVFRRQPEPPTAG